MAVNGIEFAVGQRWKTRGGKEVEIVNYDDETVTPYVWDLSDRSNVTDEGRVWDTEDETHDGDLVALIQDEHGFIPWSGGERPVAYGVKIEFKMKNDPTEVFEGFSDGLRWEHIDFGGDIIAYRVVGQQKRLEQKKDSTVETTVEVTQEPKYTVEQVFKAINEATDEYVAYTSVSKVKSHLANAQDPDYKLYLELKAKFEKVSK